ncbi:MAG: hypothetical protein WBP94_17105 [Rhodomicrobiaceae bacterium]
MSNLFLTEEDIDGSPAIVGYQILRLLADRPNGRISIFDLAAQFQKTTWYTPKRLYFGMIFLRALNAIEFNPPYVERHA